METKTRIREHVESVAYPRDLGRRNPPTQLYILEVLLSPCLQSPLQSPSEVQCLQTQRELIIKRQTANLPRKEPSFEKPPQKKPAVRLKLWRLNSIYFCPWLCQSAPLSECMDMSSCLLLSTKPSI